MYRDGDGDRLPTEKLDSNATTVIPPSRKSAPSSVRSAQRMLESAQTDGETAYAVGVLHQAMERMENADQRVFTDVGEATSPKLIVQRSPSKDGATTLKSCLKGSAGKKSTTSGQ
jgi:hypothetical protein